MDTTTNLDDQQRLDLLQKFPLEGHCEGRFGLTSINAAFLQKQLPDGLVLAQLPNGLAMKLHIPKEEHPLLLMFNNTTLKPNPNLEKIAAQQNSVLELQYNEFIVMLPYVEFANPHYNSKAPYCFLPVLYLDNPLAVWGGRIFWFFNKEMADFTVQPGDFKVSQTGNESLLSGSTGIMKFKTPEKSLPNFEDIKPILQLPVVESGGFGVFVSSIYKILLEEAKVFPAAQKFINTSCKYLPHKQTIDSPSIEENPLGAFYINYQWELSYIDLIKPLL